MTDRTVADETQTTRDPFRRAATVVTDAGLETWLVFHRGVDLPAFAAYPLAGTEQGRALLTEYFAHYVGIARRAGTALVLDAPTWRANPDWASTLGHDRAALARLIEQGVDVLAELRRGWTGTAPFVIGGAIGPRGDGYRIDRAMSVDEAAEYHAVQMGCFRRTPVEVLTALTLGYADEAIGIGLAARDAGYPVVLSFTVETNGRLPSGMPLGEAIEATDAATDGHPTHYMVNCAHPVHLAGALRQTGAWTARLGGLRANASTLSHAELDEMTELDDGDPADLAARYVGLRATLPGLRVIGGCCGTDHRHVDAIVSAWTAGR